LNEPPCDEEGEGHRKKNYTVKHENRKRLVCIVSVTCLWNLFIAKDVPSGHKFSRHPTLKNIAACLHTKCSNHQQISETKNDQYNITLRSANPGVFLDKT
jgi:hypothetical protein